MLSQSVIGKIAVSLRLRSEATNFIGTHVEGPQMSVEEIHTLIPVLESLFKDKKIVFPINLSEYGAAKAEMEWHHTPTLCLGFLLTIPLCRRRMGFENSAQMVWSPNLSVV